MAKKEHMTHGHKGGAKMGKGGKGGMVKTPAEGISKGGGGRGK
jgi:hypothetical protein